ncbi:MAG: hypothetical protein ABR511_02925 [Acidimicrobiales bacterium]
MSSETQLLWEIAVALGAVVVVVVVLLLALLRESVANLEGLVGRVWSSAVGVFVHTVSVGRQVGKAEGSVRTLTGTGAER